MSIMVRFANGADPVPVEAASAPAALREINRLGAYVMVPITGGYEVIRFNPRKEVFESATGHTPSQALEGLLYGEGLK